jgi:hypothetical protein
VVLLFCRSRPQKRKGKRLQPQAAATPLLPAWPARMQMRMQLTWKMMMERLMGKIEFLETAAP